MRGIVYVVTCHSYALKAAATHEALISQTRDGVANGDGGQAAAIREAAFSQTRDGVAKGDGGQTAAFTVFATYCVPIRFV